MSFTVRKQQTFRDSSGLAITISVHLALGYIALTATGIVDVPFQRDPRPIIVDNILVKPTETLPPPPTKLDRIDVTVVSPAIEIEDIAPPVNRDQPLPSGPTDWIESSGDTLTKTESIFLAGRLDPRFLARFQPPYPAASKRIGEAGRVVVSTLVGADGRVRQADIAESSGYARLDQAAIEQALAKWRFIPATRDGDPVESRYRITVRFVLND